MKKLVIFWAILGFLLTVSTHRSHAAVLVITVHDPATMDAFGRLSESERQATLQEVGDIIDARQDSPQLETRQFGTMECNNNPPSRGGLFVCLELRGLSYEEARKLTVPIFHGSAEEGIVFTMYRRFRVDLGALPQVVRDDLYFKGVASLDFEQWKSSILDKGAAE